MLGPKRKYFQTPTDITSSEQLRKLKKIKPFGHSKAPKKKKMTDFAHFPRPGENDPYMGQIPQDGENGLFVSLFFGQKQSPRVAKP